jgi:hypothetical protein
VEAGSGREEASNGKYFGLNGLKLCDKKSRKSSRKEFPSSPGNRLRIHSRSAEEGLTRHQAVLQYPKIPAQYCP